MVARREIEPAVEERQLGGAGVGVRARATFVSCVKPLAVRVNTWRSASPFGSAVKASVPPALIRPLTLPNAPAELGRDAAARQLPGSAASRR